MKYRAKRGSVGRPLVIKKLKRPEGTITIRYKKIREKRFAKDIINMINGGKKYDEIAKHLGLTKAEVITINQNNTLRHGSKISKININDMINLGLNTKEISKIYDCKESNVIALLKDIDLKKNIEYEKEINISINARDMLNKGFDMKCISKELNINRYKLFSVYNKYFEEYSSEVIDFDIIEKLLNIKLSYDDISRFYSIPKEYLMILINMNEESKVERKTKKKEKSVTVDEEDILTKSYNASNIDFYARKYN